jgi:uncharacterized protein (UPF0332 family)
MGSICETGTALYLEKAATLLSEAGAIFTIHLHEAAGRTAYLAGFHAAQAFIFENTGRTPKTHSGVLREFLRLTKDDPPLPPNLRVFLSQSYNLKALADYQTGPAARVPAELAATTIEIAKRFVERIVALLACE